MPLLCSPWSLTPLGKVTGLPGLQERTSDRLVAFPQPYSFGQRYPITTSRLRLIVYPTGTRLGYVFPLWLQTPPPFKWHAMFPLGFRQHFLLCFLVLNRVNHSTLYRPEYCRYCPYIHTKTSQIAQKLRLGRNRRRRVYYFIQPKTKL